jgi:hypothetical protein
MPLFLRPDRYINVPLEETYQAADRGLPAFWRSMANLVKIQPRGQNECVNMGSEPQQCGWHDCRAAYRTMTDTNREFR